MNNKMKLFSITALLLLVTACATPPPTISFTEPASKEAKIAVVYVEPQKSRANYTGNIGLLDFAIIAAANSGLNNHLEGLSFDDYIQLPKDLSAALIEKGYSAVVAEKPMPIDLAKKLKNHKQGVSRNDYSRYKEDLDVDHVLIIRMPHAGTTRPYYGFMPVMEPMATASLWAELVEIETNKVMWYQNLSTKTLIPGPWDEKNYPNLTNSVYTSVNQVIEMLKADMKNPIIGENSAADKASI